MNKCAEDSKNEKLKVRYLKSIGNDLKIERSTLEINPEILSNKINVIEEVMPLFTNTTQILRMELERFLRL